MRILIIGASKGTRSLAVKLADFLVEAAVTDTWVGEGVQMGG